VHRPQAVDRLWKGTVPPRATIRRPRYIRFPFEFSQSYKSYPYRNSPRRIYWRYGSDEIELSSRLRPG